MSRKPQCEFFAGLVAMLFLRFEMDTLQIAKATGFRESVIYNALAQRELL